MKYKTLNLAPFIRDTNSLGHKIAKLKNQKSLTLFGPMIEQLPPLNNNEVVLQVDTHRINSLDQTLILGDGDSAESEQLKDFDYLFPTDKDFTDFEAALFLISQFPQLERINLFGFWAGRFDHQILIPCQLTELLLHLKNIRQAHLFNADNKLILQILGSGEHVFDEQIPFSIITPTKQFIELQGDLLYAGKLELDAWSGHGISNLAKGQWSIQCQLPIWKYILSN